MKKIFFAILFVAMPLMIFSQNLNGRFTSSFYTFERFNSTTESQSFIRTYQALNANLNYDKFSLRTRFNYETNIGDALAADPRVRFYNLFLEARDILDLVTIKLGRQPLITPIAGGLFDGINLKIKYSGFSLSGYYGGNVPAYQKLELTDDFGNDNVLGGRFEANALDNLHLGVSYINKNFKPIDYAASRLDENRDPISILILSKSNQYQYLSGDVWYNYESIVDINARYEYDLNFKETSKIEVDGRIKATEDLGVSLYYNKREPKIRYNSIFSVFNYGGSQEFEGGVDYKISGLTSAFIKFGNVEFDGENSSRFTLGANSEYGSISYRKNFGDAGELDAVSIYSARSFADGFITPSVGVTFTSYKLSKDDAVNTITALLAGFNIRPWTKLSFDLQGQYFDNKIYKNDVRLLVKVNYLFNTNF